MIGELTLAVWIAAAAAALVAPGLVWRGHTWLRRALGWLGRRRGTLVLASGVLGAVVPAIGAYEIRWPQPSIHDEFAYLLMADTFVHGRCAMPAHPAWQHFETYHVLQQPTYAAKYPPAMAVPLAVGMALCDEPRVGLWLQAGLLAAALAWLALGWLPARWAALAAAVGLARFCTSGPWVQTFYNGAVPAIGGALVFGALGRVLRAGDGRPVRALDSALLGVGFGVLATSRPFEGVIVGLVVGAALALWVARRLRAGEAALVLRGAWPAAAVMVAAVGALGLYNRAVTGSATRLPYAEYDAQYSLYPPFLWQPVAPEPEFRHAVLREFATGFQRGAHGAWGDSAAMTALVEERAAILGVELLTWPLVLPFVLGLVFVLARRPRGPWPLTGRTAPATAVLVLFAALCTTTYLEPRYAAPVVGVVVLLVVQGLRSVGRWRWLGRARGGAIVLAATAAFLATRGLAFLEWRPPDIAWFGNLRARVSGELLASPGDDLVLVRCVAGHSPHHIWVANGADIDAQPIIWARDMGDAANGALAARYPGRAVWRLTSGDLLKDGPKLERIDGP